MHQSRDLDLNLIRVFCAVAEHGNLSRAAAALHTSKATVSRKLAQLEADLGQALVFRSTTDVSLTDLGRSLFVEVAPPMLALGHAVQRVVQADGLALGATVRITAPEDFGAALLVPLLAEFSASWPQIRVECLFTERVLDLVRESIDIAVRMGPARAGELVPLPLGLVPFDFVASPDYLERAGEITRANLSQHVTVAFGVAGSHTPFVFPDQAPDFAFPARIWSKSFASIYQLVRAGYGASFIPRFLVRDDCAAGRLVRVAPGTEPSAMPGALLTLGRRRTSPAAAEVLRFLHARLPSLLA
jgi:DNA-binding transcriptional LysR family regulator